MQPHVLKNSIVQLQVLRSVYHSQLDASALAELDDVIQQLTRLAETDQREYSLGMLGIRALSIIDNTLRLVTNITDLMR